MLGRSPNVHVVDHRPTRTDVGCEIDSVHHGRKELDQDLDQASILIKLSSSMVHAVDFTFYIRLRWPMIDYMDIR